MSPDELKQRRQALGLTQQSLGERLGVSRMAVYYWERGSNPIPAMVGLALKAVECEAKIGEGR